MIARSYLRYLVPLLGLSLVAFAPLLAYALRVPVPANLAQAKLALRTAWALGGLGLIPLLVLVGGAAPAVRAIADGRPLSQLGCATAGLVGLARALLPCLLATAAIVLGGLALVVPGLTLLVLFALTGASTARGLPGPLVESVAIARARALSITLVLLATLALGAGAIYVLQRGLPAPLPKKPTAAQLAAVRDHLRLAVALVALIAPLPAVVLAALHTRRRGA